jgi:glycosyltransferase involved in cell wall biosynthesis
MTKPTVSFVIPMYNEELNIDHAIDAAVESLETHASDYEIVIVDDASTDSSPSMVDRRAAA